MNSSAGDTSMSSRPNSAQVSSGRPDARIRRFPSAGSISTGMPMSDSAGAVPRATDPNNFGLVAPYRYRSAWNPDTTRSEELAQCEGLGRHARGSSFENERVKCARASHTMSTKLAGYCVSMIRRIDASNPGISSPRDIDITSFLACERSIKRCRIRLFYRG